MTSEETKEKVIITALHMFGMRGCRGVTMDDIAQAMHISKRTLYEYFANKEELLAECLVRVHDSINEQHCRAHQKVDEPLLVALYMLRANAYTKHHYHLMLEEAERYYPEIHDRYFKVHTKTLREMLKKGMDYALEHHYLRQDADVDVAIDFLCDLIQQHRISDVSNPEVYARRLNEICFTYMRGLMTTETIERYEKSEPMFKKIVNDLRKENGDYV